MYFDVWTLRSVWDLNIYIYIYIYISINVIILIDWVGSVKNIAKQSLLWMSQFRWYTKTEECLIGLFHTQARDWILSGKCKQLIEACLLQFSYVASDQGIKVNIQPLK